MKQMNFSNRLSVIMCALMLFGVVFTGRAQCVKQVPYVKKTTGHAKVMNVNILPMMPLEEINLCTSTGYRGFRNFFAYYDVKKQGYFFWNACRWSFAPTVLPFLNNRDLKKAVRRQSIDLVGGLSLDLYPYKNYPRMMRMYPTDTAYNLTMVPMPVPGRTY